MNLYLISQDHNENWDTYDSAIVCAESENQARMIHPGIGLKWDGKAERFGTWCDVKYVQVKLIGEAIPEFNPGDVICASFNAG